MEIKYLLDTQCFLWWFGAPEKISKKALKILKDPQNSVYFSAASSWEIAIKFQSGKLRLPLTPKAYIHKKLNEESFLPLSIHHEHSLLAGELPAHHRDPFDRMLIAQAKIEDLVIITSDKIFKRYPVKTLAV